MSTLESGKVAGIVVVAGDPARMIADLRNVQAVVQRVASPWGRGGFVA